MSIYHDIVTDKEIEILKTLAETKVIRILRFGGDNNLNGI